MTNMRRNFLISPVEVASMIFLIFLSSALFASDSSPAQGTVLTSQANVHVVGVITPEDERYCAGDSGARSIKFLEIRSRWLT